MKTNEAVWIICIYNCEQAVEKLKEKSKMFDEHIEAVKQEKISKKKGVSQKTKDNYNALLKEYDVSINIRSIFFLFTGHFSAAFI